MLHGQGAWDPLTMERLQPLVEAGDERRGSRRNPRSLGSPRSPRKLGGLEFEPPLRFLTLVYLNHGFNVASTQEARTIGL